MSGVCEPSILVRTIGPELALVIQPPQTYEEWMRKLRPVEWQPIAVEEFYDAVVAFTRTR